MMRCEKSDGLIVAMMSVPVNAGNSWEDKTLIAKHFWSSFFLKKG